MEKVVASARIENLADLMKRGERGLAVDQVRRIDVPDALVDTTTLMLSLPARLIQRLGLRRHGTSFAGRGSTGIYEPVRLTIQGRDCVIEVLEVSDTSPVLIGQMPLAMLDFVIDPARPQLIGNPEHGGEQMIESY